MHIVRTENWLNTKVAFYALEATFFVVQTNKNFEKNTPFMIRIKGKAYQTRFL